MVLDLKSENYTLGNATINDLTLVPGNHSVPVNGFIDLEYLISNLHGILETQSEALDRGFLRLDAIGRSVVYDGVEIPYYTKAMQALTLSADVSIASLVSNTLHGVLAPNGTNIFSNLTDPEGPSNVHDIVQSIPDEDGSLGLDD